MRKILEPILFLISFFNLLGLLVMIPVAMFAPARVTKPWSVVSLLTLVRLRLRNWLATSWLWLLI